MNKTLEAFARAQIKEGLAKLKPENHRIFKLMYARNEGKRSVEDAEQMPIAQVVDEMPANKLDLAIQQVQRSVDKSAAVTKEQTI